jgi:hypothetical protein
MKVSRKVARRKYSRSSSISRIRLRNNKNKKNKSGYRKKYTQRGGGCYRSKKVGMCSRKYKRARTYKRRERFHKGGQFTFGRTLPETYFDCSRIPLKIINLKYYKHDGSLIKPHLVRVADFLVEPEYYPDTNNLTITLSRDPPSKTPLSFKIEGIVGDAITGISGFASKMLTNSDTQEPSINYSFINASDIFKQVQLCISNKIVAQQNKLNRTPAIAYADADADAGADANTS